MMQFLAGQMAAPRSGDAPPKTPGAASDPAAAPGDGAASFSDVLLGVPNGVDVNGPAGVTSELPAQDLADDPSKSGAESPSLTGQDGDDHPDAASERADTPGPDGDTKPGWPAPQSPDDSRIVADAPGVHAMGPSLRDADHPDAHPVAAPLDKGAILPGPAAAQVPLVAPPSLPAAMPVPAADGRAIPFRYAGPASAFNTGARFTAPEFQAQVQGMADRADASQGAPAHGAPPTPPVVVHAALRPDTPMGPPRTAADPESPRAAPHKPVLPDGAPRPRSNPVAMAPPAAQSALVALEGRPMPQAPQQHHPSALVPMPVSPGTLSVPPQPVAQPDQPLPSGQPGGQAGRLSLTNPVAPETPPVAGATAAPQLGPPAQTMGNPHAAPAMPRPAVLHFAETAPRAEADLAASLSEPRVFTESTASLRALTDTMPSRAELPRHVALQLAEAIQRGPNRPVELMLNPAELGRVRINLQTGDSSVIVHIAADRPETLDLMRRHVDLLAQDFHEIGYGAAQFSFAGHGSGQQGGAAPEGRATPDGWGAPHGPGATGAGPDPDTPSPTALHLTDRVDIRI